MKEPTNSTSLNFWSLNKYKVLARVCLIGIVVGVGLDHEVIMNGKGFMWQPFAVLMPVFCLLYFLVFIIPSLNAFKVIKRLASDESELSIMSLIGPGYTIDPYHAKNYFFHTTICMKGTIADLPFTIRYEGASRSAPPELCLDLTPLARENSKKVYQQGVSFPLKKWSKELTTDIKPAITALVEETKSNGYTSGVGRKLSTVHFDAYE